MRYAQGVARGGPVGAGGVQPSTTYQIAVQGIPFQVAQGGSKLIRLSSEPGLETKDERRRNDLQGIDDPSAANTTPKKVSIGGVTFVRSKKGNLHRLGAVVSKKCVFSSLERLYYASGSESWHARLTSVPRNPRVVKRNELCKRFTATGTGSPPFFPISPLATSGLRFGCSRRHGPACWIRETGRRVLT
jgi:hypothetical protein